MLKTFPCEKTSKGESCRVELSSEKKVVYCCLTENLADLSMSLYVQIDNVMFDKTIRITSTSNAKIKS